MVEDDATESAARSVFRATFPVRPTPDGTTVDPPRFGTTPHRTARPPGRDGSFLRDRLRRGALGDGDHVRTLAEGALGATVTAVSFSELRTNRAYLAVLRAGVGSNVAEFRADTVETALPTSPGSSIRVGPGNA